MVYVEGLFFHSISLIIFCRMLDANSYKIASADMVNRIYIEKYKGATLSGADFTFEFMAREHPVPKVPEPAVDENVDYGARHTVDPNGACHAEKEAEKYFTAGKDKRQTGYGRRRNRPAADAYEDAEMEEDVDDPVEFAFKTAEKSKKGKPDDHKKARTIGEEVHKAALEAAVKGTTAKKKPGRTAVKVVGIPAMVNSFIIFRRRNFGDWVKHRDPCPLLLAEVQYVNDKYNEPLSYQPRGPKAEKGPWRYYVNRWDLHQRKLKDNKFVLYKAYSRFHPCVIEKERENKISTYHMTKEQFEECELKPAKGRLYGYCKAFLDFSENSEFVLLKEMASFTSTENLCQYNLNALLRQDSEFNHWYGEQLLPRSSPSSSSSSSSSADAANESASEPQSSGVDVDLSDEVDALRHEELRLCLVEIGRNEDQEDDGGRFSENGEDEDFRFRQHSKVRYEDDAEDPMEKLLSNIEAAEEPDLNAFALAICGPLSTSSSSASSASLRPPPCPSSSSSVRVYESSSSNEARLKERGIGGRKRVAK